MICKCTRCGGEYFTWGQYQNEECCEDCLTDEEFEPGEFPHPLERLAEGIEKMREIAPTSSTALIVEMALDYAQVVLVDSVGPGQESDLDAALRRWLTHTRAPSGAFGQSVENTMAYSTTRRLRSVAAAHLSSSEEAPDA